MNRYQSIGVNDQQAFTDGCMMDAVLDTAGIARGALL